MKSNKNNTKKQKTNNKKAMKKKGGIFSRIFSPFKSFFQEMKKVSWCKPKALFKNSGISILIASCGALILYILDLFSAEIVSLIGGLL